MGAFSVTSMYRAPGIQQIDVMGIEELLVHPEAMFKKGVQLAAGYPMVKVGDVLAMFTSGPNAGKYRRYVGGQALNAQVTGDNSFILTDKNGAAIAPPFVVGDIISIGSITGKTVSAVNASTGQVTISGTFGGSVAQNAAITLTTNDGTSTAACIAARPVFPTGFMPGVNPTVTPLLDQDYLIDGIWQAIVRLSVVRGLDAAAATAMNVQYLTPMMDACIIR